MERRGGGKPETGRPCTRPGAGEALESEARALLSGPVLASSGVARATFECLLRATLEGRVLSQAELAEALYGDAGDTGRARAAVRSLRSKLDGHYSNGGRSAPWRLRIPAGAYRLELDPGPARAGAGLGALSPDRNGGRPRAARLLRAGAALALAALVSLQLGARVLRTDDVTSVRFEPHCVVAAAEDGRDLWAECHPWRRRAVPTEPRDRMRLAHLADVDGDGANEVLVAWEWGRLGTDCRDAVALLDDDGARLWKAQLGGGSLDFGGRVLPGCFSTTVVRSVPVGGDSRGRSGADRPRLVVASGLHVADAACPSVLLRPDGTLLWRFFHAGHLDRGAAWDLDGDGLNEIVLGGVSNEHDCAAVAILPAVPVDRDTAAPHSAGTPYSFDSLSPPPGLTWIVLPHLIPAGAAARSRSFVRDVRVAGERLEVLVAVGDGAVTYVFERDLGCTARPHRDYADHHDALAVRGLVDAPLGADHARRLQEAVRIWQDGRWRPDPPPLRPGLVAVVEERPS